VRVKARFTTYTPSPAHIAAAARVIGRPDIAAVSPVAVSGGVYRGEGAGTILIVCMILLGPVAEAKLRPICPQHTPSPAQRGATLGLPRPHGHPK
jgi:hypothetical protein